MPRSITLWHADSPATWTSAHADGAAGAEVRGMGIGERMPGLYVDRPHGTADHLLIHFHDPVEILLHGEMREHPAHTFVVWPPRAAHRFGSAKTWAHSWLLCSGARIASCIGASGLNLQEPIAQSDAAMAMRYLRLMHDELARFQPPDPHVVEGLLSLWLREAFRDCVHRAAPGARIPARMLAVRQAIDSDPAQELTLVQLAQRAQLSSSQFSAEFRRCFGVSPIAYVLRLRLKRSLFYLSDRNLTIKEVALRCGFPDQRYFARQFRARFGKPPSAVR
ncbi:MAG: helix-turn-helix transcriptional regulator [Planctomycetes bacterium]|nr:helix-turn-helix transcriptional regulator [Planctomycetota bacterium]